MCKINVKLIFSMLTYANLNMKRTWQVYGPISCLKLVLNKLKKMRGSTFIYTLCHEKPQKQKLKERF